MALATELDHDFDAEFERELPAARPRPLRRRLRWVVAALVLTAAAVTLAATRSEFFASSRPGRLVTHRVARGDLVVTVTEDGNIESTSNVDVRCEVAGGSTILWIIKDGTQVNEGDELVRLDSSAIEEQINQQKIAFEKAQATKIEAEKTYAAAKIAVQEYVEGAYVQAVQDADAKIKVAMENLRSAQNSLQHTERMARKGYVTGLQRDAQAFAVERARLDLASAQTAKRVLEKFTRAKTVEDLESARDTAAAKMRSEQAAFELEDQRLKRLSQQLEKCVIRAPRDGMVIYANESGRWGNQSVQIEEGAAVRERQVIIRLPDLTDMQVKVTVHEAKVNSLKPGMRARIRVQDRNLQGTVVSVANQAEPNSFFSASVKEYATIVKIDGQPSGLKPGMTASAEILVAHLKNVVTVPVQAVAELGGKNFCWVNTAGSVEQRPLEIGIENNTTVRVVSGLEPGEQVLLNPRSYIQAAQKYLPVSPQPNVAMEFGSSPSTVSDRQAKPAAGAEQSALRSAAADAFMPLAMDKNGDKKLSRDELNIPAQFFDAADKNKDGFVDLTEIAAMKRQFQQSGGAAGQPGRS